MDCDGLPNENGATICVMNEVGFSERGTCQCQDASNADPLSGYCLPKLKNSTTTFALSSKSLEWFHTCRPISVVKLNYDQAFLLYFNSYIIVL